MLLLFFLQVNTKGVISFDGQIRYYLFMPLDAEYFHRPVIAPLACDVDTTRNHGRVYFRATTDNATLQRASSDVSSGTDFAATLVVITTWHDVTFKIRFYGTPVSKLRRNSYPPLSASNMQFCGRGFKQCMHTPLFVSPSCCPVLPNVITKAHGLL